MPLADWPSPNAQAYEAIDPSLSVDPLPLKFTASGAVPDVGVADAAAVGGELVVPDFASTNSDTLCAGTDVTSDVPPVATLVGPVIAPDARRQSCAGGCGVKFARLMV